ncbi:MAG: hypothetical protein JST30_05545 [Armatimonadetes bacterium]|nr:hypothetical protein [Armatimonadota bacterium]
MTAKSASFDLKAGYGPTAATVAWSDNPVRWAFVKTGLVQENRDTVDEWLDPQKVFSPPVPAPGAVLIGIDFEPRLEDIGAAELGRLLEEGRPPRSATVKVRHFRTAVAIVRTAWNVDDDPASHVAVAESGLAAEIRPLMDPTRLPPGADIKFEVAQRGREADDIEIEATHFTSGRRMELSHKGVGGLKLSPDKSGAWGLSCTFARPLKNDPEAQYAVYTATLCFSVPDRKEAGR